MKTIALLLILFTSQQILAQPSNEQLNRSYHQFDFWLGTWEVYKYGTDTLVGQSRIESIIDGLGLLENYSVAKGPLMVATVKDPWGNVIGLIYNPAFKLK